MKKSIFPLVAVVAVAVVVVLVERSLTRKSPPPQTAPAPSSTVAVPAPLFTGTTTSPKPVALPPETAATTSTPPKTDLPLASALDPRVSQLLLMVNQERAKDGAAPLKENGRLDASAQAHAEKIVADCKSGRWTAEECFNHNAPDGTLWTSWPDAAGYYRSYFGENLARSFDDFPSMVASWMASPKHRYNILFPKFEDTGFGFAVGEYNGAPSLYVVEHFGNQAAAQ